jgi:putative transposase
LAGRVLLSIVYLMVRRVLGLFVLVLRRDLAKDATCERLLGTLRRELLDRMLIFSEAHLRAILAQYQVHYNTARPHQGIDQRVPGCERKIPRITPVDLDAQRIRRKPVLNGLINEYNRAA